MLKKIGVKLDRLEVDTHNGKTIWYIWSSSVKADSYEPRTKGEICETDVEALSEKAMSEFLYENFVGGKWERGNEPNSNFYRFTLIDRRNLKRYAVLEGDSKIAIYVQACYSINEAKQLAKQTNQDWFESSDLQQDGNEKKDGNEKRS